MVRVRDAAFVALGILGIVLFTLAMVAPGRAGETVIVDWFSNGIGIVYTGYRVGIGTANPASELDVAGNATIRGTLVAKRVVVNGTGVDEMVKNVERRSEELAKQVREHAEELVKDLRGWVKASYYNRTEIDEIVASLRGDMFALNNSVLETIMGVKKALENAIVENYTNLRKWVIVNYYNRSEVESIAAKIMHLASSNLTATREALESYIVGNISALRKWVEANYYNRSEVDSWRLIKNYRLEDDLDANGHDIVNVNVVSAKAVSTSVINAAGTVLPVNAFIIPYSVQTAEHLTLSEVRQYTLTIGADSSASVVGGAGYWIVTVLLPADLVTQMTINVDGTSRTVSIEGTDWALIAFPVYAETTFAVTFTNTGSATAYVYVTLMSFK